MAEADDRTPLERELALLSEILPYPGCRGRAARAAAVLAEYRRALERVWELRVRPPSDWARRPVEAVIEEWRAADEAIEAALAKGCEP